MFLLMRETFLPSKEFFPYHEVKTLNLTGKLLPMKGNFGIKVDFSLQKQIRNV